MASLELICNTRAGHRFANLAPLAPYLVHGSAGSIAREKLGKRARPVQAVLFDKTADANWSLGWHQDRTIALRARVERDGFNNWTIKQGIHHAEPPFGLLSRMVTLRLHLDDAGVDNAPLIVAPGSHLLGLIPERKIGEVVAKCGTHVNLANAGDVWCYSTPILHASQSSKACGHRRVLQVDYGADDLPEPLQWLSA